MSAKKNPIPELLDDALYQTLQDLGLLNERAIRDYYIRKEFSRLRGTVKSQEIIKQLRELYPYLSLDSVRKIAYSRNGGPENLADGKPLYKSDK